MKLHLIALCICFALALFHSGSCLSEDQRYMVTQLGHQIDISKMRSKEETKLLRNLSVALNDRTALEAMLTDPDSAAYKVGLISLAQAVKLYAWIGRDDQPLMQSLQAVANRLKLLLTTTP
ncbi:hypothetical protein LPJ53_001246 [Coemansia erecta]|uniref:Uncharacterized protein n=1 Tax=Coemansia erecta TaxID=147472 RepID=A0A9W7Y3U0_9FUNG|nr:hypothetical protein LPJ53_001246 [Coemansia erecta]